MEKTINISNSIIEFEKITRVEVIDKNGRNYVNKNENNFVQLSFQDDGKTLKVFIDERQ